MNLQPSEEQESVAAAARDFLAKQLPIAKVRALGEAADEPSLDDATWRQCSHLGWLGLSAAEEVGGLGLGLPEDVMLFRELGRHVTPGPFLPSVLAARVAALSGAGDVVKAVVTGHRRVGMAVGGRAVDARAGDLLLRLSAEGGELVEVSSATALAATDPGIRLTRPELGDVVASASDPLLAARARTLAAAQLLGVIEAVRDMSAAYARTRVQFGKQIGTFQAVKHRCADMAIAAYAATGQVFQAALYVDAAHPDAAFHAATAYVLAARGARRSCADNIQNHGGIGFTWEHDAHLYLKRAVTLENLFGPLRDSYADVLAPARHEFR